MALEVCCFICHRYRAPEKMTGSRCTDREACLKVAQRAAPVKVPKRVLRAQFESRIE